MKNILLIATILLFGVNSFSQINEGGLPISFQLSKDGFAIDQDYETIELIKPNQAEINTEDFQNDSKGKPYRIAKNIPLNYNISTSGTWTKLNNGDMIWRLGIKVADAKALSLYFSEDIIIPDGGKLYVYNENHSQTIGAYTSKTPKFTSMEMIQGELITLEYYMPSNHKNMPTIKLNNIAYYYRGVGNRLDFFAGGRPVDQDRADACQVDVACSEILGWEEQRDAVVRYTFEINGSTFLCSGAVINNTSNDCKPYILSANHCGEPTSSSDIANNVWYFNYQRPTCSPGNTTPYNGALSQTMTGGFFRASSELGIHPAANVSQVSGSDFLLIELGQTIPSSFNAFYSGWNRGSSSSSSGVSIHHPAGDEKKISTYSTPLVSITYNGGWSGAHWEVLWDSTTHGHGVTEGGSSGSPIFNSNNYLIGHLSGGSSYCNATDETDLYGKMNKAWDQDGNNASSQLKPWLDPTGTGATFIEGTYAPCSGVGGDDYCTATSVTCDEYIASVTFGGLNNTTQCDNYSYYWANNPPSITKGSSYQLDIFPGIPGGSAYTGDQIAAWIDWNGDNDFNDANEEIENYIVSASSIFPLVNFVTVPNNAVLGNTRMRIRITYDIATEGVIEPCGETEYGEVEDYLLNILDFNNVNNIDKIDINIYPNPSNGIVNISFDEIEISEIIVRNALGQEIYKVNTLNKQNTIIDLTGYENGLYLITFNTASGYMTRKLMVEHE